MLSTIYEKHKKKRKELIEKLFEYIAKETIGRNNLNNIKLSISDKEEYGACYCRYSSFSIVEVGLEIPVIEKRIRFGYSNFHYKGRAEKLNKYILHNRHNTIRFILYHEVRHAYQRIKNTRESMTKAISEHDADDWAIKHLEGAK